MAAKKLSFIISADNNPALKALRAVNQELYKINKPFKDIATSMKAFGRESGFTKLADAFKGTANAAGDVASRVESIIAPLLAVTGVASLAAVGAMAEKWSNLALKIRTTEYQTGMSFDAIQRWQGVGSAFGITTDTMAAGMENFTQKLRDAQVGADQGLRGVFQTIGFQTADSLKDAQANPTAAIMKAIKGVNDAYTDKQGKINYAGRHAMMKSLGLDMFEPILAQGGLSGLQKAMEVSDKYRHKTTEDEKRNAFEFLTSKIAMTNATLGLEIAIGSLVERALTPLIYRLSDWLKNDAVSWLKKTESSIQSVVRAVGGWTHVFEILAVVVMRRVIVSLVSLSVVMAGQLMLGIGMVTTGLVRLGMAVLPGLLNAIWPVTAALIDMGGWLSLAGAAVLAAPVEAIVAAVVAIAGVGYLIYRHFDSLGGIIKEIGGAFKAVWSILCSVWEIVKDIGSAIGWLFDKIGVSWVFDRFADGFKVALWVVEKMLWVVKEIFNTMALVAAAIAHPISFVTHPVDAFKKAYGIDSAAAPADSAANPMQKAIDSTKQDSAAAPADSAAHAQSVSTPIDGIPGGIFITGSAPAEKTQTLLSQSAAPLMPPGTIGTSPSVAASSAQNAAQTKGRVDVKIDFMNMLKGVRPSVKTTGDVDASTNIYYSPLASGVNP